jgi:hypothetical protein
MARSSDSRLAAACLTGLAAALLLGLLTADSVWGLWLFGLSAAALPVALIGLALTGTARSRGAGGTLAVVLGLLFVLLEGAMIGVLATAGSSEAGGPWLLGLPLPTALLLFGLCLVPLPVAALAYAWTFDRLG